MDDAVKTIGNAVSKMGKLLAQLKKGRFEKGDNKQFFVEEAVAQAVNELYHYQPKPKLKIKSNYMRLVADRDRFTAVIVHLIKNSQEATNEQGSIEVTVGERGGEAIIEIEDTGVGMDEDFIINKLFRPFETTKGNAGMGIGVYETREYIKSLNGSMSVESQLNIGTKFSLKIPLEKPAESSMNETLTRSEATL